MRVEGWGLRVEGGHLYALTYGEGRSGGARSTLLLLLLLLLWHLVGARVVGLLATESCLLGSRVLPPITGAA